ncbi:MAG: DUF4159 domain-containing protein [Vicinamibacterales bacterium]
MTVTRRSGRAWWSGAALVAVLALGVPLVPRAAAQAPVAPDERFAGLEWTFARLRYPSWNERGNGGRRFRMSQWDQPWAIDAPAAEQNLSRRVRSVTAIDVGEPVVVAIDEELWKHPWIYIVEPSNLALNGEEASMLREYFLRGGTATLDDFHGPYEWDLTERALRQIFPDRDIVEIEPPHPIYTCFYKIDKYPQIPGLGSFFNGRTWEKGGYVPHLRGILDDTGRPMVLINWNTDMGDGVEWSNAEEYPGYIKWTAMAYQMMINEVIYTLTH